MSKCVQILRRNRVARRRFAVVAAKSSGRCRRWRGWCAAGRGVGAGIESLDDVLADDV
ncbi:TPA: hypothetical protein ACU8BG_002188 [Neisseria subflava]